MGNVFKEIGHGVEVVIKDIPKLVTYGEAVVHVIEDGKAMTPEFKAELATLTNDAKAIAEVLGPVVLAGGVNAAVDIAALEPAIVDIVKLVKDAMAFLPTIEAAVAKIKADMPKQYS